MAAANVTGNKNTAFDSSTKSILARGRELRTWLLGKAYKEESELNKLQEEEVESFGKGEINNDQKNLIERSKEARGVKTGKEIVSEGSPFTGKDIHAAKSDSVEEAGKSREQSVTFSNDGDEMNDQANNKGTAVEGVIFSTLLKYFTLVPKLIKVRGLRGDLPDVLRGPEQHRLRHPSLPVPCKLRPQTHTQLHVRPWRVGEVLPPAAL